MAASRRLFFLPLRSRYMRLDLHVGTGRGGAWTRDCSMGSELRRTFYRISSSRAPVHGAIILQPW